MTLVALAIALGAIALMSRQLSRVHLHCSILNQCIADMLKNPRAASTIARDTRVELIRRGLVDE